MLDEALGIGGNSDKLVRLLGGAIVGGTEGLDEELEKELHQRVQGSETRVLEIFVVHLPIILSRDVAVTEVVAGADGFGFGAGDGNDEVVGGEVEVTEIELAEGAEEFAEGFGENLEPAGLDGGVVEPVNSLLAVLGGVDGGVGIETVELEEDFFGATRGGEPVAN